MGGSLLLNLSNYLDASMHGEFGPYSIIKLGLTVELG